MGDITTKVWLTERVCTHAAAEYVVPVEVVSGLHETITAFAVTLDKSDIPKSTATKILRLFAAAWDGD